MSINSLYSRGQTSAEMWFIIWYGKGRRGNCEMDLKIENVVEVKEVQVRVNVGGVGDVRGVVVVE